MYEIWQCAIYPVWVVNSKKGEHGPLGLVRKVNRAPADLGSYYLLLTQLN